MSGVFSSAAAANKRELVIKRENPSPESQAVLSGDFSGLFSVTTLNHLRVTGFGEQLASFPALVGRLEGLLQLILTGNALTGLPAEVGSLSKLKHLDVSQNRLEALPASLYSLHALHTLVLSHNHLTEDSFPALPTPPSGPSKGELLPGLHHLDLLGNRLTKLPPFVYAAHQLQELIASDNAITILDPAVGALSALKHVDLKRNGLTSLPYELTACSKLKVMRFEENPLSDRRLLKLVAQHGASKPKAVLDYIASHAPKSQGGAAPGKGGKGNKGGAKPGVSSRTEEEEEEDDDGVVFAHRKTRIEICRPEQYVEVTASQAARSVRPYLVCAVVRGVDLTDELTYKEFITLQVEYRTGAMGLGLDLTGVTGLGTWLEVLL